jgi:L-lactate dehydrogenase (cytochrome)
MTKLYQLIIQFSNTLTGIKTFCLTVDRPQLGKREKDLKILSIKQITQNGIPALSNMVDPGLDWEYVMWFKKKFPGMRFLLKGVQTGIDAVLAGRCGVAGVIVSNHGGRQLDGTRSSIEILNEVTQCLKAEGLTDMEVYLDGGIRRVLLLRNTRDLIYSRHLRWGQKVWDWEDRFCML